MTKDEALKLALEALDGLSEPYDVLKAQEAIRKALAQPEQEPVAWVNRSNLNSAAIERNRGGQGDTHTWSETFDAYHTVPLYTTPPHRKPLTDEEIDKLPWEPHESNPMTFAEGLRYFARAIEAAHGIKE